MKRSEKYLHKSRRHFWVAMAILAASVAGTAWSLAYPWAIIPSIIGGIIAMIEFDAAARYFRSAGREERYEWERLIRQRP